MGVTTVNSNVNFATNMALCVWLSYYEANNEPPQSEFHWDKVGAVWFTIVIVPWFDNDHEFGMGRRCSTTWYAYIAEAKKSAKDVANFGKGKLGHLEIIGKNLTSDEAEDRLISLAYWGDGFKVADKTLTLRGGPQSSGADYKTIDISAPFDKISVTLSN